ncbi:DUF3810 domain-containing protein [Flavihumibacter rivuli]|uniref:DUF3810 domain-containing protein n=1 Tax=Flavihumibacter rivuli TaxID=2838156 RepID=UPI001BDF41C3|nr:DUF3810 domain-containing protein [Flavihumibacter rivuli]ULQ56902.1 DUF3810 domain-containing protein [Flavihumibacter rivuli]
MNRKYAGLYLLLGFAFLIKVFSLFPRAVELYYSRGAYPYISRVLRFLFGWIPFSVGDLLYVLAATWLIFYIARLIRKLVKKEADRYFWLRAGMKVMTIWLWIYVVFNLFWGLNYNRQGIARQAGLVLSGYETQELDTLVNTIIDRMNALHPASMAERDPLHHKKTLFHKAADAYRLPPQEADFLRYTGYSVKPSLFSYAGNYMGFTGYYNPFTGEAQVNTTVPVFVQPFTTCHEIGHQLGYAKENEANLAGFLSAKNSASAAFRYSAYFDLYLYAMRDLYLRDSSRYRDVEKRLSAGVRKDLVDLRKFNYEHIGLLEPLIRSLYAQFLRVNQQPSGLLSYNQVVAMVVSYMRRYGKESI